VTLAEAGRPAVIGPPPRIGLLDDALREALSGFLSGPRSLRRRLMGARSASGTELAPVERAIAVYRHGDAPPARPLEEAAKAASAARLRGAGDRETAEAIAAGYRLLEAMAPDRAAVVNGDEMSFALPCIDPAGYREPYLRPVRSLHEYAGRALAPFVAGLYVHGSLATLDFACDYSDFDTLMVVRSEVATDADRLLALVTPFRRSMCWLFEFDPLQHHAHIVLTEFDLERYVDALFPLSALDGARALGRDWAPLRVLRRSRPEVARWELERVCAAFRGLADSRFAPATPYDLKSFLSELMLLPSLYQQAHGRDCRKRDSFARTAPEFSAETWRIMEEASAVRAGWRYERRAHSAQGLAAGLAAPELARKLAANEASAVVRQAMRVVGPDLVPRAAALADAILRRAAMESAEAVA